MIKIIITVLFIFSLMATPTLAQQGGPPSDGPGSGNSRTTLSDLNCLEDEIAVFSETLGWVCGSQLVGGGPTFIVMDNDPAGSKQVGDVYSVFSFASVGLIIEVSTSQGLKNVELRPNADSVFGRFFEFPSQELLRFELADCTGPAYVDPFQKNFGPAFSPGILASTDINGITSIIFAENPPVEKTFNGFKGFSGSCFPDTVTKTLNLETDYQVIIPDITTVYPLPYTLHKVP